MVNELVAAAMLGVRPSQLAIAIIAGREDHRLDEIITLLTRMQSNGGISNDELFTLQMANERYEKLTAPAN